MQKRVPVPPFQRRSDMSVLYQTPRRRTPRLRPPSLLLLPPPALAPTVRRWRSLRRTVPCGGGGALGWVRGDGLEEWPRQALQAHAQQASRKRGGWMGRTTRLVGVVSYGGKISLMAQQQVLRGIPKREPVG